MGFNTGNDNEEISNINITPMVDVILVLLVIFMVTANFLKKESVNINLPKVAAADPNVRQSIQIALTRDGMLLMEGVQVSEEDMMNSLTDEVRLRPNMRVTISADERLEYSKIARLMGLVKKAGVTKLALSVKK